MTSTRFKTKEEKEITQTELKLFDWKSVPTIERPGVFGNIFGEFFTFYNKNGIEMSKDMIKLGNSAVEHESGLAHYWVMNIHVVIFTNADLIQQLFKHKKLISRSEVLEANFAVALGASNQFTIPVRNKDKNINQTWAKSRQAITDLIHKKKLARDFSAPMAGIVNEVYDNLDTKIREIRDESKQELTIDLESLCMKITMLVTAKLLLGVPEEDKRFVLYTDMFARLYTQLLDESFKFANEIKYRLKILRCCQKTETEKKRERLIEAIEDYFLNVYEKNILATDNLVRRIAALDPINRVLDKETGKYIEKNPEDFTLDTDNIKNAVAFYLLVGHDTTSRAIQFMIMHLSEDEELQKQGLAEIKKFKPADGVWTPSIVSKMPILNAIFTEGERLHPGAPILGYKILEDITLDGKKLGNIEFKKDSVAMISLWNTHRSPKYFENPDQFNHTRFLGEEKKFELKPNSKTPQLSIFGLGERPCPAYEFAPFEAIVALIEFILRYKFKFKQRPSFRDEMLGTLRHEGPANLTIWLREAEEDILTHHMAPH